MSLRGNTRKLGAGAEPFNKVSDLSLACAYKLNVLGEVTEVAVESVERRLPIQRVRSSNPSHTKPMTYRIDACCLRLASLALGINVTGQGLVGSVSG